MREIVAPDPTRTIRFFQSFAEQEAETIRYWRAQPVAAKIQAVTEMAEDYVRLQGIDTDAQGPKELIESFHAHGVEYLVIGGHAVSAYSEPRNTKDLDILIRDTPENGERVYRALADFGAPLEGYTPSDLHGHAGQVVQFGLPPARIDILQSIQGVGTEEAWQDRQRIQFADGLEVNLISLRHLIQNKKAAGRLQDLADAEKLERYLREE